MAYPSLTFDLDLLPPGQMTMPRIVGAAVEGGASLSGVSYASDATGGGFVAIDYNALSLGNRDPMRMRFAQRLATALSGGVRTIIVPFLVDFIQPMPVDVDARAVPHSDGAPFGDTSLYASARTEGAFVRSWGKQAGTVFLTGVAQDLVGGEWLGVLHPTAGARVYNVTDVDSITIDAYGNKTYQVGIRPTLREAVWDGQAVAWRRPRCTMRLAPGFEPQIDVSPYWFATPSLKFVEAF